MVNLHEPFLFVPRKSLMRRSVLICSLLFTSLSLDAAELAGDAAIQAPSTTLQTQSKKPAAEESAASQSASSHTVPLQQPARANAAAGSHSSATQMQAVPDSAIAFQSLAQLDEMVALGMSSLALRLLDDEQKRWPEYSPDWYAFENKRMVLLADSGRWQQLLTRSNALLAKAVSGKQITERISQWFIGQQVVAHLQLKQPEAALQKARLLLWNQPGGVDNAATNVVLRQLIVRAYLQLDDVIDARKALQKYQQDYAATNIANGEEWKLLQARVLLRTSRYKEVISLLADSSDDVAKALSMLASVRANPKAAYSVVKAAEAELAANERRLKVKKPKADAKPPLSKNEVWAYNYVIYEREQLMHHRGKACIALERMLALGHSANVLDSASPVDADDLWQLYEAIGQATGNENKLLVGDDAGWGSLARKIHSKSPIRASGLYAVLALNAHAAKTRDMAYRELLDLVSRNDNGMEIISRLYLDSPRIQKLEMLPEDVRFRLVDYTLTSGQIGLAARLMLSLQEPPEDKNPFAWRMRKARVLVLEGDYAAGVNVLRQAVEKLTKLDSAMLDQYLQVVFDLQAVEQHEAALALFALMKYEWLDAKYQRELYFWKAESNYALKRYAQSAWLYLMSARAVDPTMSDPWSQSARFKAADALTKARLFDDAYTMYDELLAMTANKTRRTWIRQAMQQIELLRNAEKVAHAAKS